MYAAPLCYCLQQINLYSYVVIYQWEWAQFCIKTVQLLTHFRIFRWIWSDFPRKTHTPLYFFANTYEDLDTRRISLATGQINDYTQSSSHTNAIFSTHMPYIVHKHTYLHEFCSHYEYVVVLKVCVGFFECKRVNLYPKLFL